METIIGLGKCGCSLAQKFSKYSEYKIYLIDTEPRDQGSFFLLPKQDHPEKYEKMPPDLSFFFKDIRTPVLFIMNASGYISGASLAILEQLRHVPIKILCIRSNKDLLSGVQRTQQKIVLSVLQEYARSGIFEQIYIIDNESVENIIGNFTVYNYHDKINEIITSTIHMINVFKNTNHTIGNIKNIPVGNRIASFSILDLTKEKEVLLFPLQDVAAKRYFFAINENKLKEDKELFKEIMSFVKKDSTKNVSFGVYSTLYDSDYVYVEHYSSVIQNL
jgi:hypothetical protein